MNETFDIRAIQGKTFALTSTFENDDGTPVNLTGYTGRMQVRPSSTSEDVIVELTTANSRFLITDAANGRINFTVSAADMAALPAGNYVYDTELVNGTVVMPYLSGRFIVVAEVTK